MPLTYRRMYWSLEPPRHRTGSQSAMWMKPAKQAVKIYGTVLTVAEAVRDAV